MASLATSATGTSPLLSLLRHWPLALGGAAVFGPTLLRLAREDWTTETGVQGPIVMATALWIFYFHRRLIATVARPGSGKVLAAIMPPLLIGYVAGRVLGILMVEVAAAVALGAALFYAYAGWEAVRRLWFGLVYLAFIIPLPGWFRDQMTGPLKIWISQEVTRALSAVGYPVIHEGVVMYVSQYQLLVEDACSGLNSLTSLIALGLFYIYMTRGASLAYALFLALWIVPFAILANMVRVAILVLLTYHFGDATAQGVLHDGAGIVMFVVALMGIILVDAVCAPLWNRYARSRADAVAA